MCASLHMSREIALLIFLVGGGGERDLGEYLRKNFWH